MQDLSLKSKVGTKVGPYEDSASVERLAAFAQAVGAKSRQYGLPTFLTVCRKGEFELLQKLNIPLSRVLHGEQEYVFENQIQPGSNLIYETTLATVLEKKGTTPMQFMVFETVVKGVGTSRSTIILRGSG